MWSAQRLAYKAIYEHYYNSGVTLTSIVPLLNESNGALHINISMSMTSLNGFDAVSGLIDISGEMYLEWFDEVVADEYVSSLLNVGDSLDILIEYDKAWTPNLVLVNDIKSVRDIGEESYLLWYELSYPSATEKIAKVSWRPRFLLQASCSPDVTYYPFDRQECDFTFTAWGYRSPFVTLNILTSEWDTSAAQDNGVWKIVRCVNDGNTFMI